MNSRVKITTSISKRTALAQLPTTVDLVEVRCDITGNTIIPNTYSNTPLVYVLRSIEEGGTFTGTKEERKEKLRLMK